MKAIIGTHRNPITVELTELVYDEARECVVCPACGEALEYVEPCFFDHCNETYDSPSDCDIPCYLYVCPECGKKFYSAEEI